MKTANPLSPWSTLNTTTKTKMISWKSTSSTGCNTSTASLSRHFSAALCKHRVKFEDQYHFCKLHKAALKISMLQNHRVVTSLLNTQDLSWNIEPQPSSPWSQHTHTQLVTKGGPYRFFLKSKKKKKISPLTQIPHLKSKSSSYEVKERLTAPTTAYPDLSHTWLLYKHSAAPLLLLTNRQSNLSPSGNKRPFPLTRDKNKTGSFH